MKFAEATNNTKFRLPPWRAHLAFLTSPSARPFLLLSCIIHAIVLGILWRSIDFPLFSGTPPQTQGNPHFDIFLTGAPQAPPASQSATQSPARDKALIETQSTHTPLKQSSDIVHPVQSAPKPTTKPKHTPAPVVPKTNAPAIQNPSQPNTLTPREEAIVPSPQSNATPSATKSGKTSNHEITSLRATNVALSKKTDPTSHTRDTDRQDQPETAPKRNSPLQQTTVNLMITRQVKQALGHHLHYPYIARRRGWDGKVMLGFQVNRQGRLINIHLSKSSGHTVLDSSALSAMREIKQVINLPELIPEVTAILHIPVVFQLTQG